MVENNSMLELNIAHKCLWDATYRFNMHCVNHIDVWNITFFNYTISLF